MLGFMHARQVFYCMNYSPHPLFLAQRKTKKKRKETGH